MWPTPKEPHALARSGVSLVTADGSWGGYGGMPLAVCRLCGAELTRTFVDLGMSPLCESYVPAEQLDEAESFYPLHVRLCG